MTKTVRNCSTCARWRQLHRDETLGYCALAPCVFEGDIWMQPLMRGDEDCAQYRRAGVKRACAACKWWASTSVTGRGSCRKRPPVYADSDTARGLFPETLATEFCGEFDPR